MFRKAPTLTEWEVYPSIDIEVGHRLLAENFDPYGREQNLSIEFDTVAAVALLKSVQPADAKPTGVHVQLVDGPIESQLLRTIRPDASAAGDATRNKDRTVSIRVTMNSVPRPPGNFKHLKHFIGRTVAHELIHATDFGSRKARRAETRFKNKVMGPVHKRFVKTAHLEFARRFGSISGLYTSEDGVAGLSKGQAEQLALYSPFEKRAYQEEELTSRKFPAVIQVDGYNNL